MVVQNADIRSSAEGMRSLPKEGFEEFVSALMNISNKNFVLKGVLCRLHQALALRMCPMTVLFFNV